MRYIRTTTPSNIYSLKQTFVVDRTYVTCFKTHGNRGRYVNDTIETEENLEKWLKYNDTSILKQADTIEELVDCYSYETETTTDLGVALGWKFANQSRHIYGCIKTGKGLIYVAEMNKEGELKLL